MKRLFILVIALTTLMLVSVTASAQPRYDRPDRDRHPDRHQSYRDSHNDNYRHDRFRDDRPHPFRWNEHRDSIRQHYHLERVYDRGWHDRFPERHVYRWHGDRGFWHHGHYITDAVLFFDNGGRLISIGYMHSGVFIQFREDRDYYENHDSFFFSWWHRG